MDVPTHETRLEAGNRFEALSMAVRNKLKEEKADEIVTTAEKYFKFLQGNATSGDQ